MAVGVTQGSTASCDSALVSVLEGEWRVPGKERREGIPEDLYAYIGP